MPLSSAVKQLDINNTFRVVVKRRASEAIRYDFLVPGGPYDEQWDWDGFFTSLALIRFDPADAIYLRNWALNYLIHTNPRTGYTPGLLTPKGPDPRLLHIKPFLAQGCLVASRVLGDVSWLRPYCKRLMRSVTYRERHLWSRKYDLGVWYDAFQSGADNNIAVPSDEKGVTVGADLNAFLYLEYRAMSELGRMLRDEDAQRTFRRRATQIKRNVNQYLWDEKDQSFYNLDTRTGELIRRCSYSNFIPLYAGLATPANGRAMIQRYLLSPRKLYSRFGIRSLAKDDPAYNNRNIIKPYSNWQGPIWLIVNHFALEALRRYAFRREARLVSQRVARLLQNDIEKTGGMHENYDAETGESLAAPNFVSWNLLADVALAP